jgi:S-formylglutathione hydrolase FrmB
MVATMLRRRTLLLGAAGVVALAGTAAAATALAANGVIPGQSAVDHALGYCDADVPPVGAAAGPIVDGSFASTYRRREVAYRIAYPPGFSIGARLPVCLMLHGFAATETDALAAGDYPRYLAAAVAAGVPPFALAAPAGGNGYWHPHPDDDPLGMVIDEFLPLLGAHGLGIGRVAVSGYSMGGFGALMCALAAPERFVAVAANAPAFWRSYDEANHVNPGAFGSAAEWSTYGDLLRRADDFRGLPVRIFVGSSDPFEPAISALRDRLPDPGIVTIAKGCHDERFWESQAPTIMRLVGHGLVA